MPSMIDRITDVLSRIKIRFTSSCCQSVITINEATEPVRRVEHAEPNENPQPNNEERKE